MKKRKQPIIRTVLQTYEGPFKYEEDQRIEYKELNNITIQDCKDARIVFDTVLFSECTFINNHLVRSEFIDCIFEHCDFSNNRLEHSTLIRTIFEQSKLDGTSIIESNMEHILIKDSTAKYLDLANDTIDVLEIKDSIFEQSNWFEAKMKNITFDKVDLQKSDIYQTSLKDINLSTSNIEGMKIDVNGIKGAIISPEQAILLCSLIGVKIKE